MYNRYIAHMNPAIGEIEALQREIDALVLKEIGRPVSTLEDIFSFLKSLDDQKLYSINIFDVEDLSGLNVALFIVTFEIIGTREEHSKFFFRILPLVILCIVYERKYHVAVVTLNDMHEFEFCWNVIDKTNPIGDKILDFFQKQPE